MHTCMCTHVIYTQAHKQYIPELMHHHQGMQVWLNIQNQSMEFTVPTDEEENHMIIFIGTEKAPDRAVMPCLERSQLSANLEQKGAPAVQKGHRQAARPPGWRGRTEALLPGGWARATTLWAPSPVPCGTKGLAGAMRREKKSQPYRLERSKKTVCWQETWWAVQKIMKNPQKLYWYRGFT